MALDPELPVVISTGHGDHTRVQSILELKNVAYLLKPYESQKLIDALADVTGALELPDCPIPPVPA